MFPRLAHMRIDLLFSDPAGQSPASQTHVLHPAARAFFAYPCPYAECEGRFDLSRFARESADHVPAHVIGTLECPGERTKGRHAKSACGLRLTYDIAAASAKSD
jgi:hypothetical protein